MPPINNLPFEIGQTRSLVPTIPPFSYFSKGICCSFGIYRSKLKWRKATKRDLQKMRCAWCVNVDNCLKDTEHTEDTNTIAQIHFENKHASRPSSGPKQSVDFSVVDDDDAVVVVPNEKFSCFFFGQHNG